MIGKVDTLIGSDTEDLSVFALQVSGSGLRSLIGIGNRSRAVLLGVDFNFIRTGGSTALSLDTVVDITTSVAFSDDVWGSLGVIHGIDFILLSAVSVLAVSLSESGEGEVAEFGGINGFSLGGLSVELGGIGRGKGGLGADTGAGVLNQIELGWGGGALNISVPLHGNLIDSACGELVPLLLGGRVLADTNDGLDGFIGGGLGAVSIGLLVVRDLDGASDLSSSSGSRGEESGEEFHF